MRHHTARLMGKGRRVSAHAAQHTLPCLPPAPRRRRRRRRRRTSQQTQLPCSFHPSVHSPSFPLSLDGKTACSGSPSYCLSNWPSLNRGALSPFLFSFTLFFTLFPSFHSFILFPTPRLIAFRGGSLSLGLSVRGRGLNCLWGFTLGRTLGHLLAHLCA